MKKSFEGWLVTLSAEEREAAENRAAIIQFHGGVADKHEAEQLVMKQWRKKDNKYEF